VNVTLTAYPLKKNIIGIIKDNKKPSVNWA
jgi:hypothetical protein